MIVAVDGPAAAGKGTLARSIAARFGFHFLDTGSLYRMVARSVLSAGGDPTDTAAAAVAAGNLDPEAWEDSALRGEEIAQAASVVAAIPDVRAALLDFQRAFAARKPGAVLDGRDIGTIVCPGADVKIFVTATAEIRAFRRQRELEALGPPVAYEDVLADIRARDERDRTRAFAPLVPAADAHLLDTSRMTIDQAIRAANAIVGQALAISGS